MQHVKVSEGQTLLDIAILHCGSIEAAMELAVLNNLALTTALPSGAVVAIGRVWDIDVVSQLAQKKARPARNDNFGDNAQPGGIGFMQIGNDFIVS